MTRNLILSSIFSLLWGLICLPVWLVNQMKAPDIQAILGFILPIILVLFNTIAYLRTKSFPFNRLYVILPIGCIIYQFVAYCNWGVITGRFLRPDPETIEVVFVLSVGSVVFTLILCGIAQFILTLKKT